MADLPPVDEFVDELRAWCYLAVAAGLPVVGLWAVLAHRGRSLLSPQRQRAVPWSGFEVAVLAGLVLFVWPALVLRYLHGIGFFTWLYGPEFRLSLKPEDLESIPQLNWNRALIWADFLAKPFQLATIPLLLRVRSGARLYQLGLTLHRGRENVVLGFLVWLLLAPPVYVLNWLVTVLYQQIMKVPPEEHALAKLAADHPLRIEWLVILLLASVAAPAFEELFFRGLLQPWFASRPYGGNVAIILAVAAAVLQASARPEWAPTAFVLSMVPGYLFVEHLTWRWLPQPHAARAIYGTALFFAASHSSVWPTPIPLFLLGLGLGTLAFRTQSLVGPIVLHSLFNAVACMTMLT
jgi:membrane protease YdiL (CAAX protease family)